MILLKKTTLIMSITLLFSATAFSKEKVVPKDTTPKKTAPAKKEAQEVQTMQELREVLTGRQPVVIMFYAPWCSACKSMKDSYNAFAAQFDSQARVIKVNADNEALKEAVDFFGIEAIPTIFVKHVGVMTSDHLMSAVKAFIGVKAPAPKKEEAPKAEKSVKKQPAKKSVPARKRVKK